MYFSFLHLIPAALFTLAAAASVSASPWAVFSTPSEHDPKSVGTYTNGCLLGAAKLPAEGPGYQVVRLSRNRNYGHPVLVDYLADLGLRVNDADLGTMLVADVAMPRGGAFDHGHRSHQTGLDADVWLRLDVPPLPRDQRTGQDDVAAMDMVDGKNFLVDRRYWTAAQAQLLHLAAADDRVARIFVHPAIKKALCEQDWPDRAWLRRIRPWHGHTAHFHVRLHCPTGDDTCRFQEPPPAGDGCGAELASWLPPLYRPPSSGGRKSRPPLPAACQALLADASRYRQD